MNYTAEEQEWSSTMAKPLPNHRYPHYTQVKTYAYYRTKTIDGLQEQ
jgi:hypothetical protein